MVSILMFPTSYRDQKEMVLNGAFKMFQNVYQIRRTILSLKTGPAHLSSSISAWESADRFILVSSQIIFARQSPNRVK